MSWISDSSELVAGGWLTSAYAGHGILGSDIPTTGGNGGSPVLNDGVSPTSEYRWALVTPPGAGTLVLHEDLSFEFSHTSDITTSFTYRLFEDGIDVGTATVSLQIGASTITISATTSGAGGNLTAQSTASCTINATTGAVTASMSGGAGAASAIVSAITQQVSASIGATGYVPSGMTLSPDDIAAIVAALPSAADIAAAIISLAQISPIHSDIRKVANTEISGSGTELDPWGPV